MERTRERACLTLLGNGTRWRPRYKLDAFASHWTMESGLWLGSADFDERGFVGEVGDLLVYSKALSRSERYAAEAPLLAKYLPAVDE